MRPLPLAFDNRYWQDEFDGLMPNQRRFYDGGLRIERVQMTARAGYLMAVYPNRERKLFHYTGMGNSRTQAVSKAACAVTAWLTGKVKANA